MPKTTVSKPHATKLTEGQDLAIRAVTRLQRIIAGDYGVSQGTISLIKIKRILGWQG